MLQPFAPLPAIATLLMGLAAMAQATPAGRAAPRSIVLTGKAGESPLIHLAPGSVTLLLLDAPIVREAVEVEGRARFAVVDVGDRTLTLSPAVALGPEERLALRVTYREGFPASAVFLLSGPVGAVDEVVNVSRPRQTGEACLAELAATRERCETRGRELEALKARPSTVSPAAMPLAGFVDQTGLRGKPFTTGCTDPSGEVRPFHCWGLGGATWSVVVLDVRNTGDEPWAPAWAEVRPTNGGDPRRARAVLSAPATFLPGSSGRVAVELEMPARHSREWLSALHTLRVCDREGNRCLFAPQVGL